MFVSLFHLALEPTTLEAAFHSFSHCTSEKTRLRLEKRLSFFHSAKLRSEEEVKKLPEHEARNEQEQVLSIQDALWPPGTRFSLHGLATRHELNGHNGTVLACLRDGSFRCAVELDPAEWHGLEEHLGSIGHGSLLAQASARYFRPLEDCNRSLADIAIDCKDWLMGGDSLVEGLALPLDEKAIGHLYGRAIQDHSELAAKGALPEHLAALGASKFSDMPFSLLVMVTIQLTAAACAALQAQDVDGAIQAVDSVLDLERHSRPEGQEMFEQSQAVRNSLGALMYVSAVARATRGDPEAARLEMLAFHRLNTTASISERKIRIAHQLWRMRTEDPQRLKTLGMQKEEVRRLQKWWLYDVLALDEGDHDSAAATESHSGMWDHARRTAVGDTGWQEIEQERST